MRFFKNLSVGNKRLAYKLSLAFALMSIIPLLTIAYFVSSYVMDNSDDALQAALIVLFALFVALGGYFLLRSIIDPVINLAFETKVIAEGNYDASIMTGREDELGDIANAVNTMTDKMRSYISELQQYSRKTKTLNQRIHKKVHTLTNLMELGDLISSGAEFDQVSDLATEKMVSVLYGTFSTLFIKEKTGAYSMKSFSNNTDRSVPTADIEKELPSMEKFFSKNEHLLIDSRPLKKPWQKELRQKLEQMNIVFFAMKSGAEVIGVIAIGNFKKESDGDFQEEDIEVIRAFEKELVLGFQSTQAAEKVKNMDIVDSLTGLYTLNYLKDRLDDEINRAVYYQRPCSLIVLDVDDFAMYSDYYSVTKAEQVLKQVGKLLGDTIPSVGKVARFSHSEFGLLLPEMNKRESLQLAEDIRKKIQDMRLSSREDDRVTVSIGVGENPIDGANAEAIIAKASEYAEKAREAGMNKVVGE